MYEMGLRTAFGFGFGVWNAPACFGYEVELAAPVQFAPGLRWNARLHLRDLYGPVHELCRLRQAARPSSDVRADERPRVSAGMSERSQSCRARDLPAFVRGRRHVW